MINIRVLMFVYFLRTSYTETIELNTDHYLGFLANNLCKFNVDFDFKYHIFFNQTCFFPLIDCFEKHLENKMIAKRYTAYISSKEEDLEKIFAINCEELERFLFIFSVIEEDGIVNDFLTYYTDDLNNFELKRCFIDYIKENKHLSNHIKIIHENDNYIQYFFIYSTILYEALLKDDVFINTCIASLDNTYDVVLNETILKEEIFTIMHDISPDDVLNFLNTIRTNNLSSFNELNYFLSNSLIHLFIML